MKKISALLLSLALGLQTVNVFAASDFDDWQITFNGEFAGDKANLVTAKVSEDHAYDGSKSLYVICTDGTKDENNFIEVKNPLAKNPESGKYTFKMYAKYKTFFEGNISIGGTSFDIADMTVTDVTAPSGTKSWQEYTYTFDYEKTDNAYFSMKFYYYVAPWAYMDNFSLTKDGESANYIVNPDWEEFYEETVEQPYDTTDYLPENMICSGYSSYSVTNDKGLPEAQPGGACFSWRNPTTTELEKVSIYDVTDGEMLIDDTISVTPGALIYKNCPVADGEEHLFKVVFSYKTKSDREYFFTCSPSIKKEVKGTWTMYESTNSNFRAAPLDIYISPDEGYEGGACAKITANVDRSNDAVKSNTYACLENTLGLVTGKTYAFSFMVKSENMKQRLLMHFGWEKGFNGYSNGSEMITSMYGTHDWTKFDFKYTCVSNYNTLRLCFDGAADALLFDNFECYELDEDGEPIGENLFSDGDFDSLVSNEELSFSEANVTSGIGEATISWNCKSSKFGSADIYQKVFDGYEYRGTVSSNFKSVTFNTLKQNEDYTFKIVPVNTSKYGGEAKELTVTTNIMDYDITAPILTKGGAETDKLSGAGEYKITTTAKNNLVEEGISYEQLVGIYEGKTLVKVYSTKAEVPKKKLAAPYMSFETAFTLPEGDYHVEVYLVKSRLNPMLYTSKEFN